jgi:hypothetical protein
MWSDFSIHNICIGQIKEFRKYMPQVYVMYEGMHLQPLIKLFSTFVLRLFTSSDMELFDIPWLLNAPYSNWFRRKEEHQFIPIALHGG